MVIRGAPQFRTDTGAEGQWQGSEDGGHGGHEDWAEAQHTGFEDCVVVFLPSLRSAASAKSIIYGVFFTMPMSNTIPMMEMMLRSILKTISAASLRRWPRAASNDGERVYQALIQNSKHDKDGEQCRGDKNGLGGERGLVCLRRSGKKPRMVWACSDSAASWLPRGSVAERYARSQLKETVTDGNSYVVDGERMALDLPLVTALSGTLPRLPSSCRCTSALGSARTGVRLPSPRNTVELGIDDGDFLLPKALYKDESKACVVMQSAGGGPVVVR